LIALLVIVVGGGAYFLRGGIQEFEIADATMETVAERFGPSEEYRPNPDGAVEAERIEAFLAARAAFAPVRDETERSLSVLSGEGSGFGKLMAGLGLLGQLAGFVQQRGDAFLEAGIGPGEYTYIYTVAYLSWLAKSPADGPSFKLVNKHGYILDTVMILPEDVVREYRTDVTRRSLNGLLLPVLRNQLADLEATGDAGAWGEEIAAEIAALKADPLRLPWDDGLPATIESSLAPYRDRLEESYRPMCNALELGLARR